MLTPRTARISLTALALLAGCLDGPAENPPLRLDTPAVHRDGGGDPNVPPPVIDTAAIPGQTCEERIAIAGTARPGSTVFSSGGGGSAIGTAAAGSGRFCLEVYLSPNQANVIEVRAQDGASVSLPATVRVQHVYKANCAGGAGGDAGVGVEEKNLALWAPVEAIERPASGAAEAITDGNRDTVAMWSGSDWLDGWDGWVKLSLDQGSTISRVVVVWRDDRNSTDKYFASDYRLLFSDATDAPTPSLSDPAWRQIQSVVGGNGGIDEFTLAGSAQPTARHVALWLESDGETNLDEHFAIAQIEVWGRPTASTGPPPVKPGVCAGKL